MTWSARRTFSASGQLRLRFAAARPRRERPSRASQPPHLLVGRARRDDDRVEVRFAPGLVQQRDVGHGDRPPAGGRRTTPSMASIDGRMHDGLEIAARRLVAEDDARRAPSGRCRRPATGRPAPNRSSDARGARRARRERRVRERVGIDRRERRGGRTGAAPTTSPSQSRRSARPCASADVRPATSRGRLASRASAATSVLLRSNAIVSGPTPPGTGVSAPATVRDARVDVADDERATLGERRAARRLGREEPLHLRGVGHAVGARRR